MPWYFVLYAGLYVVLLRSLKDYHLVTESGEEDEQADWNRLVYNICIFTIMWWGSFFVGFMMGRL